MTQAVFYVTETQPLNQGLGFIANSVIVDNLTASWLYVPGGARFIPPYQYGATVPLSGADSADISWPVPAGIVAGPPATGTAICTFTDAALVPNIGQPTYTNIPPQNLGGLLGTPATVILPTGCQSLLITSRTSTDTVTVTGGTSLGYYAIPSTPLPAIVPINPVLDPTVIVTKALGISGAVCALFYGVGEK
jgi:hypothetical protein